jgi:hypothetical protein
MSDYTIIFATDILKFQTLVNEALEDGYILVGGPTSENSYWVQAVAKVKQ